MFRQQSENLGKVKKNSTSKELRNTNAYKDFLNTTAYKVFQNAYKESQKKGINKIRDEDLANLLKQIDTMAATLVAQAEAAAAGTVRLEVPYSFNVELDDGSDKTTTYFEQYFTKKLPAMEDLFAKQKGNLTMQTRLKKVNPELFEKVYENFLKISTYLFLISHQESITALEEFLENYESTEAGNELMKMCKTKLEENKKAKEKAFDCTKGCCDDMLDDEKSGNLCCCCCCCLVCCCPLVTTCAAVTASVEGCQFYNLKKQQKKERIGICGQMKKHTWKPKKKPVGGSGRRIGK
uniref:Uncharacterized protein n=1 Tax=Globodera pallida TaxID=36090 RepID=A0A183BX13_GLOPA